jgi:plasmid maintenance system antidote protein VapI
MAVYNPDTVPPPGYTINENIERFGWSKEEFASRLGRSRNYVHDLIAGRARIDEGAAASLARVVGASAEFWLRLEASYRAWLVTAQGDHFVTQDRRWLRSFPVAEMQRLGWIDTGLDEAQRAEAVLRFFAVASPDRIAEHYMAHGMAMRTSPAGHNDPAALACWIRQGERLALAVDCADYDAKALRAALPALRECSRRPAVEWRERIIDVCRTAGVALVFVPELPGIKASGAARWIDGRPIIQLSQRHRTNDQLWFSLFHELGHILHHGRKLTFVDGPEVAESREEREADTFAVSALADPAALRRLIPEAGSLTPADVRAAAAELGIHPGVLGRIGLRRLNTLKERLNWM